MSDLKQAFVEAFPTPKPGNRAKEALADAALRFDAEQGPRLHRRRTVRLAAGFCGMIALGLGATAMYPGVARAAYIHHIDERIADARTAHIVEWSSSPNGMPRKTREIWCQGDAWRIEEPASHEIRIIRGRTEWDYDSTEGAVRISQLEHPYGSAEEFDLRTILANAQTGESKLEDDGAYRKLTLHNSIDDSVVTMWIDRKTDFPVKGEVTIQTRNSYAVLGRFESEFDKTLAANLFASDFPRHAKVIDMRAGKEFWAKKFQRKLGVIHDASPEGRPDVTIRDVEVTKGGDVFLIYTSMASPSRITVVDGAGTTYVACPLQAEQYESIEGDPTGRMATGIQVDGGPIYGCWFTPLEPSISVWSPRTLTFEANDLYYKADPEMVKRLPLGSVVHQSEMNPVEHTLGTWSIRVQAPTCGSLPDFAPFMGEAPTNEVDADRQRLEARAGYLIDHGRLAEAEPLELEAIQRIEEVEALHGRWNKSEQFYNMYRILNGLGRHDEARDWLRKILHEPGRKDAAVVQALELEHM